ncbi:carbohydrate ABC transporter permease [Roseomonas terrae]|jgi:ABC-type glycerol-3-phosphate transport system permease component|uniref:Carbohydrate ABC transporter permease n=1 Tax=Neoroseomonas terrae TaxID=424799 RepID=A0ABS5EJX6_9PROT|nr:carbohydrate ABC transporter permease [Neoroseomonas terrae]MBR0651325.1 carbohydrate ABC transporter permease [Neoroseomonas terrae]
MRPWAAAILYAVLGAITFVVCFPLLWAISTSLKPKDEIFRWPPTLWPENITFEAYRELLFGGSVASAPGAGVAPSAYFLTWFGNSIIVSVGSTIISITVATLAAYSLTRFRFWGQRAVPYIAILGYMVPSVIFVFPMFLTMVSLDLTDTLFSLILGYVCITLPFCLWLMWAFFRGVPIEIEEAALVDGASRLQVFRQIVLPVALPGIIAASIFSLIVSWNDYLFGRVFMNTMENLPLTVGVMHFFDGTHVDWALMMASSVLMTLPMAILFGFMQRHLVAGFGAGAVKG